MDSNHRSVKQQIYSLSPLATRELSPIFMPLFSANVIIAYRLPFCQLFFSFSLVCRVFSPQMPRRPFWTGEKRANQIQSENPDAQTRKSTSESVPLCIFPQPDAPAAPPCQKSRFRSSRCFRQTRRPHTGTGQTS